MSNSEILIEQITTGKRDDGLVCSALDALAEERGFGKLEAVLAVAAAWHAGVNAREITAAAKLLIKKHKLQGHIIRLLAAECSDVPDGARINVHVVPGNVYPTGIDTSLVFDDGEYLAGEITVGATWLLNRAAVIRKNLREFHRRVWPKSKKK